MTTYGDMMTLMLCFFVLLYAFSIVDVAKFRSAVKSIKISVEGKQEDKEGQKGGIFKNQTDVLGKVDNNTQIPQKFGLTATEVAKMKATKEQLAAYLKQQKAGSTVNLEITERGLVISFMGNILFETGKAEIRKPFIPILNHVGSVLKKNDNSIRIEGFTDNVPIETDKYPSNWELSTARATAVLKYLTLKHKLDPRRLSAAGYGEYKPKKPNTNDRNRALNRRVDIVLIYPSLEIKEPK